MTALRNMLFVAALAGLAVGVAMTLLQVFATVPLILEAETFESAAPAARPTHDHDAAAPPPRRPRPRRGGMGAGRRLPAHEPHRASPTSSPRSASACCWSPPPSSPAASAAGARACSGASPASPSSPSRPASACRRSCRRCRRPSSAPRQAWWIGTASLATGAGLALIAFGRAAWLGVARRARCSSCRTWSARRSRRATQSPIPADLHHRFVVAVTVTNLVFWLLLGYAVSAGPAALRRRARRRRSARLA